MPTNAFLFFQVLPGHPVGRPWRPTSGGRPAGPGRPGGPGRSPGQPGGARTTFNNLKNDCGATAPNCQNIGISHDWIDGQDVEALYTEPFYCGTTTATVHSCTGCEAGSDPTSVPPGVADTTPPTPTQTNSQIDPLYIPVPLYSSPPVPYVQCSGAITCIDHPATIDLSQLAAVLGAPASSLDNVPLPGHDHLLTTRNGDQPEWWNVIVIPVTSAKGLASVEAAKNYTSVKALENLSGQRHRGRRRRRGAHQRLPLVPDAARRQLADTGPVQTNCGSHLRSGSVVGGGRPRRRHRATTRWTRRVTLRPSVPPPATAT